MSSPVWPNDAFLEAREPQDQREPDRKLPKIIRCYLATPFTPIERWDGLRQLVLQAAQVASRPGIEITVLRADKLIQSQTIHNDMWRNILQADVFIADVSTQNGNVMFELGVAAAWLPLDRVIILRERSEHTHLFNISPVRHIEYTQDLPGLMELRQVLADRLADYVASVPFQLPIPHPIELPFKAPLTNGIDCRTLYTPDSTHRLITADHLEFGSPFVYVRSWMSVSDLRIPNVNVKAEMKLTHPISEYSEQPLQESFIGVMVRGQNNWANMGHLVLIRPNGKAFYTVKTPDDASPDDIVIESQMFDIWKFIKFDISIDDHELTINLEQEDISVSKTLNLQSDIPYVFSNGRIFFIAGLCRAGIKNVEVNEIQST